jgi:hypothetical protein
MSSLLDGFIQDFSLALNVSATPDLHTLRFFYNDPKEDLFGWITSF